MKNIVVVVNFILNSFVEIVIFALFFSFITIGNYLMNESLINTILLTFGQTTLILSLCGIHLRAFNLIFLYISTFIVWAKGINKNKDRLKQSLYIMRRRFSRREPLGLLKLRLALTKSFRGFSQTLRQAFLINEKSISPAFFFSIFANLYTHLHFLSIIIYEQNIYTGYYSYICFSVSIHYILISNVIYRLAIVSSSIYNNQNFLYSSVFNFSSNIPFKWKILQFYENTVAKKRFYFTIGWVCRCSKLSLLRFFFQYSSLLMFYVSYQRNKYKK